MNQMSEPACFIEKIKGRCIFNSDPAPENNGYRVILIKMEIGSWQMIIARCANNLFIFHQYFSTCCTG